MDGKIVPAMLNKYREYFAGFEGKHLKWCPRLKDATLAAMEKSKDLVQTDQQVHGALLEDAAFSRYKTSPSQISFSWDPDGHDPNNPTGRSDSLP